MTRFTIATPDVKRFANQRIKPLPLWSALIDSGGRNKLREADIKKTALNFSPMCALLLKTPSNPRYIKLHCATITFFARPCGLLIGPLPAKKERKSIFSRHLSTEWYFTQLRSHNSTRPQLVRRLTACTGERGRWCLIWRERERKSEFAWMQRGGGGGGGKGGGGCLLMMMWPKNWKNPERFFFILSKLDRDRIEPSVPINDEPLTFLRSCQMEGSPLTIRFIFLSLFNAWDEGIERE